MSLTKPEEVAECATAPGGCVNILVKKDAGPDVADAFSTRVDAPWSDADVTDPCIEGTCPGLDGPPNGVDGGPLPGDAPQDIPMVGPETGSPDGAVVTPVDGPADAAPDIFYVRDTSLDVPAGICATGGVPKPAGTVCRPAIGPCDLPESCDGLSVDCPADELAAAGKECRASAGDCDNAETCTGNSADCPDDGFKQAGTVCRKAAGPCDYAEICSGEGPGCPSDSLKQSSVVCRDAVNVCDPAESCTGLAASCPDDVPPYTRPNAPTGVTATPGELQATISWNPVAGATAYNVKRGTRAGGPYTTIATAFLTAPYIDTGLDSSRTYYYIVSAINTIASCESATNSTEVSVKPTGICVKPAAPVVTATAGNGQVTLSWAAVSGATAYAIDRSESSGTGYSSLASVNGTTTTYVDEVVVFGKTYYYVVTTKGECDSDPSTEVSAAPLCAPAAAAPTGLAATTPNVGGIVVLTWNAVAGAKATDRYYVMRKLSTGATYTKIDEVPPPAATYSDTTAVNNTAYNYTVTYYNGTCTSANSNMASATPTCVMGKPVLTVTPGNKKVDLSWTQPANGSLSGYEIYRKLSGTYTLITSLDGAGSTTYSDIGLLNDISYTYYVTAVGNCNANSDPKTTTPVCTPLAAPANVEATAGDQQVTLTWDAVTGADHYTVKRGDETGGPYTALTPASPITTNSYTDTGLDNGTAYFYVVTVSNGTCDSVNSEEATATPQTCPSQGAPGTPTPTISTTTQVRLTWTAATPQPPGGYNILRSATGDPSDFVSVGTVNGADLTFTDPAAGISIGTTLYYQIKAIGADCSTTSEASSIALACSPVTAPVPTATANTNGSIGLGWSSVNATAYTVSRNTSPTGTFEKISTDQTGTTYEDTIPPTGDLQNAQTYYYKVKATSAGGQCSAESGVVSARSCIIPTAPTGVVARRSGNKRITVAWTNSPSANSYTITRNGSLLTTTTSGSPYVDSNATNETAYTYRLTAASDTGGVCNSAASATVSAPSCAVKSGGASDQKQNDNTEWCFVTCDDVSWWGATGLGDRTLYINYTQTSQTNPGAMPLPAKGNSGYAFYFTPATPGSGGNYTFWNYGTSAPHPCP